MLLLILVVFMAMGIAYTHAETAARKKARYYYTAGADRQAVGQEGAAYEYFKKAYLADPTYAEAASAYGSRRLYVAIDTMQSGTELNRSLDMMKQYIDAYPGDLYENLFYGYVAGQLHKPEESIRVLERTYALHPESANILLSLAETYSNTGSWRQAIDALDRYEHQAGRSPQITTRKLSLMLVDKDTVGALREARLMTERDPSDVALTILRGNLYDAVAMPDSALVWYLKAEELDPESGPAKLALVAYYEENGDSIEYDKKMYEALLTEDLDLEQKTDLVANYLQTLLRDNKDHKRGDYLFSVLQSQYPHEPRLLDLSARYNAAKGDFASARDQISYAIDRDPTNITYWGQLMTYEAADDHADMALETYERAKEHIIPDEQLRMYYVSVAQMAERYDSAANMIRSMIDEIQPGLPVDSVVSLSNLRKDITADQLDRLSELLVTLGDVYHLSGDSLGAYRTYENALILDDSNAMAKNNYAYFLATGGGDLDKALALSKSSLSGFDALNPTYLDTYAWICFLKGNYAEALEYQEEALGDEDNPVENAELYEHLGDIKAALGDTEGALTAWRHAVELREKFMQTEAPEYQETLRKIQNNE
ncbi:MAG: tetratricopeptide repeat protein [Muribaculaceae bacterium]|nr:tetratricopeptide repeat protein [Muribaculaceae bacterium]